MRSEAMERLGVLVGPWDSTLRNAWFLEPPDQEVPGSATGEWQAAPVIEPALR